MAKITYQSKVGTIPKTTRVNQWWDDDANMVKDVVNENDKTIDGFWCYTATGGRTSFIVGDKFSGWIGDRFVAGKVISIPVTFPSDLDDETKIKLAIDSEL